MPPSRASQEISPLHERLLAAVGDRTYRAIANETGHNPETARRYMHGHAPSAEFLARVCEVYDINAHWLMTGSGPMRHSETAAHVLSDASPGELLSAVAVTLERLLERVDRLEIFVQTLETRVRASGMNELEKGLASGGTKRREQTKDKGERQGRQDRVRRVAGAASKRPPAHDD